MILSQNVSLVKLDLQQTLPRERDELEDLAKSVETEKENLKNDWKKFTKSRNDIEKQIEVKQRELTKREKEFDLIARDTMGDAAQSEEGA